MSHSAEFVVTLFMHVVFQMQNIEIIKVNDSVTDDMIEEHQATRMNEEAIDFMVDELTKPIKFRCVTASTHLPSLICSYVRQKVG